MNLRKLFSTGGLLLTCSAYGQNAGLPSALTVELFSVRPVGTITLTPLGPDSKIRICVQCPETKLAAPLTLKQTKDDIQLSTSTTQVRQVKFAGAFRVNAENFEQNETASGQWTISATPTGLRVLVTTSVERYVMAALNGEAAPDEPLESLKAMAVAARTFALANQHRHADEAFDLCDSTHCQALRFGGFRPEIEQAVHATAGETLWSGVHRANVYMTQHCGGETEDAESAWPAVHALYLRAHPDPYCLRRSAAKWHADIELAQIARIVNEQGWKGPVHIDSVQVVKRTATGRAQVLAINRDGKQIQVSASSFRFAVGRALGWNQLRSDWYEITQNNGMAHFEGKGYGHGVGLCQAGAFQMAVEGHKYRDILNFYFPGTQVRITPSDSGWKEISAQGWTLFTSSASGSLLTVGNSAWEKALSLFPPKTSVHPAVHLMPTTEMFRQTAEEPGWMLASTRTDIYLQPIEILQRHGSVSATLLHEFLHVLVEQEATRQTPIWLREGLVEALDDHPQQAAGKIQILAVEAALIHPATMADSQHAHLAAGQFVQSLINRYGVASVRSWLQSEIPDTVLAKP